MTQDPIPRTRSRHFCVLGRCEEEKEMARAVWAVRSARRVPLTGTQNGTEGEEFSGFRLQGPRATEGGHGEGDQPKDPRGEDASGDGVSEGSHGDRLSCGDPVKALRVPSVSWALGTDSGMDPPPPPRFSPGPLSHMAPTLGSLPTTTLHLFIYIFLMFI